jgi:hypothetical protein
MDTCFGISQRVNSSERENKLLFDVLILLCLTHEFAGKAGYEIGTHHMTTKKTVLT